MVQKNDADSRIRSCFEHAVTLLVQATSEGCDVGTDLDAAALNLGLWFANRDLFREACEALSFVQGANGSYDTMDGEDGNEKNKCLKQGETNLFFLLQEEAGAVK
jgi:hypothetical protein